MVVIFVLADYAVIRANIASQVWIVCAGTVCHDSFGDNETPTLVTVVLS